MSMALWILSEVLGVTIFLSAILYIYHKLYIFNFWRKIGVPGPEPSFPTGNITPIVLSKQPISEYFQDIYERYKDHRFCGIYTFFKPNLVIVDLDLVRDVLAKEFSSFHDRGMFCNEKIDPLTGHLFLLPGKKWRNLRVRLTPTFTSGKIKQMFLTLKDCGSALTKYLEPKARAGESIEIKDILARYSTDIIMSTAFGVSCNTLENADHEFRYWGKKVFEPQPVKNAILIFAPQIYDFFSVPYTEKELTKFFMDTFRHNVEYRKSKNIVRKDFLNLLMQLMRNGVLEADGDEEQTDNSTNASDAKQKFTMEEATAQAFVFFIAGFETSSTTATYSLYELALNPSIQDKVREEICRVVKKHGDITYDAVNEMTYLHQVVYESMRKYPPVGILNRVCTKEIDLPSTNIRIPKGIPVTIPVHAIHRDPRIYPDPEKFDPERFTEENIAARHPYAYLPFGEGPRICIGLRFGLVQVKIALISLLHKYKVKLSPETRPRIEFDKGLLISSPEGGVHLIIQEA